MTCHEFDSWSFHCRGVKMSNTRRCAHGEILAQESQSISAGDLRSD